MLSTSNRIDSNGHSEGGEIGMTMIDPSKVVQCATTDLEDVMNPKGSRVMPMIGFDDEFVDIVDYILRITYWIWHEKKVDLCLKYYSADSLLHTMTGDIVGNRPVVKNTWATLDAFPDRTLDGENIVWSVEDEASTTYYSSHLIVSRMTNLGDSEWGPATGKRARIRTIADCVCRNNVIVEEWLMRDNAFLVMTLGFDLKQVASKQAAADQKKGFNVLDFLKPEWERVNSSPVPKITIHPYPEQDPLLFSQALFGALWVDANHAKVDQFYDFRVSLHLTAGRELYGTLELKEYLAEFQQALSNVRVTIDHVAKIPYLGDAVDIAVRWSLAATHGNDSELFGEATQTPLYILGGSHFRVVRHKVREEWTVFDELAIHRQIASAKLQNN